MKQHLRSNRGFTLIEILITITIILVLAGVLMPLGKRMMSRGRAVNCSQNLRQIGVAVMSYAGDNNMTLPVTTHQRSKGGKSWTLTLQPYTATALTFKCHDDKDADRPYTYVINDFLTPNPAGAPDLNYSYLAKIDRPQATFMFAEAAATYANSDHFHFADYHGASIPPEVFEGQVEVRAHGEMANYLFADGHVESLSSPEVRKRLSGSGSCFVDPSGGDTP